MKVGKVPVAALILIAYTGVKLVVNYMFPTQRVVLQPYFDGGLIGAIFVFGLYYLNIYLTAWLRNRKNELAK